MVVRRAARQRCAGLSHRVRRGTHLCLFRRWFGLLGVAVQRAVTHAVLHGTETDLPTDLTECVPGIADLPEA